MKLVSLQNIKKALILSFSKWNLCLCVKNDEVSISPKDGYISIDAYNDILNL